MADRIPTIQEKVATLIAGMGDQLETAIVDNMVDRELQKRQPILVQAIDRLGILTADLDKINREDIETRHVDGSVKDKSYSPKRIEEIKKAKDKIEKLTKAFDKAFTHGDLKDLNQLLQSGKQDGKDQTKDGAEDSAEAS